MVSPNPDDCCLCRYTYLVTSPLERLVINLMLFYSILGGKVEKRHQSVIFSRTCGEQTKDQVPVLVEVS